VTKSIASLLDHTLLTPDASETAIRKLCEEAWIHQFKSICIAPTYVSYASEMMEFCPIQIEIASVVGYPFGYTTTSTKLFEAKQAMDNGATELAVVMNISWFKSMAYASITGELKELAQLIHDRNVQMKTVIQTEFLDNFDLYTACEIATEAGTDFIQIPVTATNRQTELITKIRSLVSSSIKLAVSGEITSYQQAYDYIQLGVERIGTSQGVQLCAGV
jgi:deoxyribose-phosphate aldolase